MNPAEPITRILIADDDEGIRAFLTAALVRRGHECVEVATADDVAAQLGQSNFDLVILDVQMPGNANLEILVTKAQREDVTPVIIVSGSADPDVIVRSFRLSAVDWLSKPILPNVLIDRVDVALARARSLASVRRARVDVQRWLESMTAMTPGDGLSMESYIAQSFLLMAQLSANLQSAVATQRAQTDLCRNLQCPRRVCLEAAVARAIDVIEKTRSSFKSRELGELRTQLEHALSGQQQSPTR
ncbi:MAG: response regulator [Deltaproteobacteria bacterium]|nr:response regulator [Deltaproteobacteria bacterium]